MLRPNFFQSHPAEGALRRADGVRLAAVPSDFLLALHQHLFEHFADNCQDLLYRAGYEQGLQDMVRVDQELKQQFGGASYDLSQMDAKFILSTWWEPLAAAGWGGCTFDFTAQSRGITVVALDDSPVAAAVARVEHPICHFFAGLFAGAISFYERSERHATEIACRAAGSDQCRFVVAPGNEVDAIEGWRQQGASESDILRRLR